MQSAGRITVSVVTCIGTTVVGVGIAGPHVRFRTAVSRTAGAAVNVGMVDRPKRRIQAL